MAEPQRPLKVSLCHAHSDKIALRGLYQQLIRDGLDVWLDKEKLILVQHWNMEICQAVPEADVVKEEGIMKMDVVGGGYEK